MNSQIRQSQGVTTGYKLLIGLSAAIAIIMFLLKVGLFSKGGGKPKPPACIPNCTDKICGNDGCGGKCGKCGAGQQCDATGKCEAIPCVPDCAGKACGDDGCSGVCGNCPLFHECDNGTCKQTGCVSNCGTNVCGIDNCGNSCGNCSAGFHCANGQCEENECVPNCDNKACGGSDGCGGICHVAGSCGPTKKCMQNPYSPALGWGCMAYPNVCNPPCSPPSSVCVMGKCIADAD
jgi:hypothetical protein